MYFLYKKKFLQSGISIQSSSLDPIIGFLLFSYSALTIRIVRIVFGNQKMNEYEYRIPLFGPNYSNSRIVRIIRPNTGIYLNGLGIRNMSSPSLHMFKTLCTVLHCEIKYLLKELKITQSHFLSVFSSQQIA